ncbi:MAG: cyanophycin synthetase [Cyanobacteria bacterium QH_8_48_120]|nr:MAG: cyanophycin synthetase [Cyanobacteria bacterium QH_6_48_35]PSO77086.1 MAG: cyanophycin synthetase [Cyanobacteria bacterium QH_8_48_120]PSO94699.1 MAG: cyanophycin synthetase [Cyanobacteria bacterium SW_6_48_11]PSP01124.1 MAG: cyanophycin synthetase [Cyanobacteria bacterium SW_7_48_12]PSP03616.1 MAG: cyanophycin synthetase [Cyanobacteria bacterium SW_12_48_29]PSP05494.1 MAG: cyanophycin synthetase [Cyanobacteria bacterium QS_7_48_42]PSP20719.1 MAG: cyanophycin synthetase [Cyanobacteria
MRILKTQTLRGPNYWSIGYHQLIVMRLDLEELRDRRSNEIRGFYEGLTEALPSLENHFCSTGDRGGFLARVREGMIMGDIIEHIALELQNLAGMSVGFGRTRETSTSGIYNVVFEYQDEQAGRYAGRAAVRLCQSILDHGSYPQQELEKDLEDLEDLANNAALGPSTEALVKEAGARNLPWMRLGARAMIQLGYGINQKRIQATLSDRSGMLAVELASDKEGTKQILEDAGVPVPRGVVIQYLDELEEAIEGVGGYPIVIKPLDGNHGRGITIDINSWEEAEAAYDAASEASRTRSVIVEGFYRGNDHRILVVDGKFVAVAERIPACVVGDGKSTVAELVEETNRDPNRGEGHDKVLTKIQIDQVATNVLKRQGYDLDSVPPRDEVAYLRATANLSTGGKAIDRTNDIHPHNIWLVERVAKIVGLDIAGIDAVTPDISKPFREVSGVVIEVNAAPGFRMHVRPSEGISRNVAAPVLDMLFPQGSPSRIPIIAITGTNGKTTTTRLAAHIFRQTQQVVGYTTTDGIYIDDHTVEKGDTTGPQSANVILKDPTVEVAVLETARGGLMRSGTAFDASDVGIVLNVAADHLGLDDIDTVEEMARVKSVVAETVSSQGYAVLNAEDPLVAKMAEQVEGKVAYFSMSPDNALVRDHTRRGGLAAVYENGYLSIWDGHSTYRLEHASEIPMTMGGLAPFMIANALAASSAAYTQGVELDLIRQGIKTFSPSANQTPGRMNLFNLGDYHALVDYAHNPASYQALGGFVSNWDGERIGVVGGPGDRRDEDLIMLGELSARIFDWVIVKEDDDTRGRSRGEAADLIVGGIKKENPDTCYETILDETKAIGVGLDEAGTKNLVVILPESVSRAIQLIQQRQPSDENGHRPQAAGAENSSQPSVTY